MLLLPLIALHAALLSNAQAAAATPEANGEYLAFETFRVRVRVENDGKQQTSLEVRVLLRTSAAVAQFGQLGLSYIDGFGEVSFEDVAIQKPDGRTVEPKDLKPEDINPFGSSGLPIAADVRVRKVTLPGLEPGDRLSYRVVLRQRPLLPGRVFGEGKLVPLLGDPVQSYELDLPSDPSIQVRLRSGLGAAWESVASPTLREVKRLSLRVPRPTERPDGPTEADIEAATEPDIIFTNFKSWEDLGRSWWDLAKDRVAPDATVRAEAERLVAGRKSPREKLEALHSFVASRTRYLSVGFGVGRLQPRPAAEVLSNRYGDCKDKHALLAALATAVGLDVRPVLIHSLRKELRDDAPAPQQFDHMISVARLGADPAQWVWIDATNSLGLPGYLTPNLRDKRAILIESDGRGRVVTTPADPPFTPRTEVEATGALDASGKLRAHLRWTFRSDDEVRLRFLFGALPRERYPEVVKASMAKGWDDGKVTNVTLSDAADLSSPFRIEFDVEKTAPKQRSDRDWPLFIPLPEFDLPTPRKEAAPDKAAEFAIREFVVRAEIGLPEGLSARAPLSVSLDRPFGQFRSSYSTDGGKMHVERVLKLSRRYLGADEAGAYDSFRKALDNDREQDFTLAGLPSVAGSAEALHAEGMTAYGAKKYEKAIDLLRKATAADPKVKDGWNDLGRALRDKGDAEAAITAFARQIEVEPFHESAYAERAYILLNLGRVDEAEKDLLKQIEIAPFKAWSLAKLGNLRIGQWRFAEAIELLTRAATIEPKEEEHWINLGMAYALAGRKVEARQALSRARTMDLSEGQLLGVAKALENIGDEEAAGVAASAASRIAERLARLSSEELEQGPYWMMCLARSWQVEGAAALTAGDLVRAEKYLDGSWRVGFLAEAAWGLGLVRQRQGKAEDAARWLSAAESLPDAWSLPTGHEEVTKTARAKTGSRTTAKAVALPPGLAPDSPVAKAIQAAAQNDASSGLVMNARTIKLNQPALADFTEEVLLVVGPDGTLESIRNLSRKQTAAFDRQAAKLGMPKLDLPKLDGLPSRFVFRGLLACSTLTTCSVMLDLQGMQATVQR